MTHPLGYNNVTRLWEADRRARDKKVVDMSPADQGGDHSRCLIQMPH